MKGDKKENLILRIFVPFERIDYLLGQKNNTKEKPVLEIVQKNPLKKPRKLYFVPWLIVISKLDIEF